MIPVGDYMRSIIFRYIDNVTWVELRFWGWKGFGVLLRASHRSRWCVTLVWIGQYTIDLVINSDWFTINLGYGMYCGDLICGQLSLLGILESSWLGFYPVRALWVIIVTWLFSFAVSAIFPLYLLYCLRWKHNAVPACSVNCITNVWLRLCCSRCSFYRSTVCCRFGKFSYCIIT